MKIHVYAKHSALELQSNVQIAGRVITATSITAVTTMFIAEPSHSTWVGIVQGKRNAILFNPCPSSVTFEHPHPDLNYTGKVGRKVCHFKSDRFKMNNSTNIDIGFPNKSVWLFLTFV